VDVDALIDQLDRHGHGLADTASAVGEHAAVPTCPGWDVRALLAHTGMVQRWASENVRNGQARPGDPAELHQAPEAGIVEWFREGHADLVAALTAAPGDLEAMTFLAGAGPARHFWARRQAHETTVHHADAAAAAGAVPEIDPVLALDGIGELLEGFYGRRGGKLRADPPITVRVAPFDFELSWTVQIGPESRTVTRDADGPVDCTLRGAAADLYLYLWNRSPAGPVEVDGDERATEVWRELARVRWG
jgi:uncharacterized protein (TIGR03083 family)